MLKKVFIVITTLILCCFLTSCGLERDKNADEILLGSWQDGVSMRASMEITEGKGNAYKIIVHWAGSAFDSSEWTMTAVYSDRTLSYSDCECKEITYSDNGEKSEKLIYEKGEGVFEYADGFLYWLDGTEPELGCIFEHIGKTVGDNGGFDDMKDDFTGVW